MDRVLITGITGFAGGHLAEALLATGAVELFGLSRRGEWPGEWQHLAGQATLWSCDLCNGTEVEKVLRAIQPRHIYHLAGYPHAGKSLQEPDAAWSGNATATRSLYDAAHRWGGQHRILYVGTGLIYGDPEKPDQAYNEKSELRPTNPYAASKAATDLMSYQYTRSPGLDIVRVRPFNHVGPRQSPEFAVAHFAKQIAVIQVTRQPAVLETGNLNPCRDLTDVRDMVRAYMLLMKRGRSGEAYNVGSGVSHSMKEVVDSLQSLAGIKIEIRQRTELLRSTDSAVLRADASKIRNETGWTPSFAFEQTLRDTLDYWRNQG